MPLSLPPAWWGPPWAAPRHRAITELIRDGVLDAELAALLWLLVERRVPVVVAAGPSGAGKSTLLAALLDFLPAGADIRVVLGPAPDLSWLPEAGRLGWRERERGPDPAWIGEVPRGVRGSRGDGGTDRPPATDAADLADPSRTVLASPELSGHLPWYAWGSLARVLVRAASLGYGLATTVHAERLEDVLAMLGSPPVGLSADELGHLGVVIILRAIEPLAGSPIPRRRVVAAHLVRPLLRDAQGHVQRLDPAVLAARDDRRDVLEHYAWGVMPEIALRIGRRTGDLERAQARRAGSLHELVARGRLGRDELLEAIADYRARHGEDPSA